METIKIELLDLRLVNGDRSLKAFADARLSIDGTVWAIRELWIEKHEGQRMVAGPLTHPPKGRLP